MSPPSFSFQFVESITILWIVAAAVLAFFALRLYRDAWRGSDRGGVVLFALRAGAILLVLLLLLDPVLSLFAERSAPARLAVLIDGSLSMTVPWPREGEVDGETDTKTRADRVADVFASDRGDLLGRLADEGRLDVYRFGAALAPLTAEATAADLAPRDDRTDLGTALAEAIGSRRAETGAVVIVSDGAQNIGIDAREEADRLGVPAYVVGAGSEGAVRDLSIVDVEAAGVAYLDNEVPVVARVRSRGETARDVTVYLSEGEAVLDSVTVDLPEGGGERDVTLGYVPSEPGMHRFRVWTPDREGELSAANNAHLFAARILKEKIRVLLVAGRPSYDLTFLRRALDADISLAVDPVILSLEEFPGQLGRRGARFPEAWADLVPYDLVILLDAGGEALDSARADAVARFVRERGGALLVMGGSDAFDMASPELGSLLPVVRGPGVSTRVGQILPRLTPEGRAHPVAQIDNDPDANAARWAELPPLASAPVFSRTTPRARVLVQGVLDGIVRSELPLVATTEAGAGRVLTIAGAPYWRWDLRLWGSGRSGDLFRKLASRAVRWLVSRDDLEPISIRPGKPLFDGAEDVVLEGQVYDDDFRPIEGADVHATVRGPRGLDTERSREISLVDRGEGRYRGTMPGLPPGDYVIEGRVDLRETRLGESESEMTVAPYRMEFENPAPDFERLRRIARGTGGAFLTLDDAGSLPRRLDLGPVVERSVREWPLLGSPLLFIALLALLGAEWALRRRRGLP